MAFSGTAWPNGQQERSLTAKSRPNTRHKNMLRRRSFVKPLFSVSGPVIGHFVG